MIRVLIVDDHIVMREGMRQLLASVDDMEVVGAAANGIEAIEVARRAMPDVVLMDLAMPRMDGVAATRQIVAELPDTMVVVLTTFSDRGRILAALDAGAIGYLLKDAEPDDVLRGVRAAARGESPLDPKAARELLAARSGGEPSTGLPADLPLTPRERDVLELLGEGLPNKLIAQRLGISEKTVKSHVTKVFEAIGVTDRTQAALWLHRLRRS